LCEHVVEGARNKLTLINVYSGDIAVGEFPASLMLGMFFEYLPDKDGDVELTVDIGANGRVMGRVEVAAEGAKQGQSVTFVLPSFQMTIPTEAAIEATAHRKGYKKTKFLSKLVTKAPKTP
jgi:hypothetical protein